MILAILKNDFSLLAEIRNKLIASRQKFMVIIMDVFSSYAEQV